MNCFYENQFSATYFSIVSSENHHVRFDRNFEYFAVHTNSVSLY